MAPLSPADVDTGQATCWHPGRSQGAAMTYKTILVHCDANPKVAHRLGVAVGLAQLHGAHLIGVHVRPPLMTLVFSDGSVPSEALFTAYETASRGNEAQSSAAFNAAINSAKLS